MSQDVEEQSRLDIQHIALKYWWRGLYPWPQIINEVLQPSDDYTPTVLDVGTGNALLSSSHYEPPLT